MNSSTSNKRKINEIDGINNEIDDINEIDTTHNFKKNKTCKRNFLDFLHKFFDKDYVHNVKDLLSNLIDFKSLSDYLIYSFVYYLIRYLSYLKSMNEMNDYFKKYNNNKSDIFKNFNYLKNLFQLIESKKELVLKITVIDNKINSDLNTIKELSKNLVSINLDIISGTNVEKYIQEYVKINYDISLIIEQIDKNNIIKKNMEKDLNTIFEDINKIKDTFIRLNNYYVNNHNLMNKIFTLSKNLNSNYIILKLIKNKILLQSNDDTKNKFTKIFGSLQMYNNILNDISVNEKDNDLFNEINDNINHYDENIESCHCNKCKEIALYKTIYHDLLVKYDTRFNK